jgi:hypothetical protein
MTPVAVPAFGAVHAPETFDTDALTDAFGAGEASAEPPTDAPVDVEPAVEFDATADFEPAAGFDATADFEPAAEFDATADVESATEFDATAESSEEALPWIEAFAVDPEVVPFSDPQATAYESQAMMAAFDAEHDDQADEPVLEVDASDLDESVVAAAASVAEPEASDDTWVMTEATADIAQLADELSAVSADATVPAPAAAVEPHLPWQEDEAWMDIMPALPNSGGRDVAAETEWARAFGEPPAPMQPPPLPTGDAQAAAVSLESIARRLRAGDLNVPGFHAERGDAAALAAALAALLGASE